mmetsp:Transcript_16117/g.34829  ORF Transcript_16117/g.34829 Transcript_16117/m.34829 type:complete len:100 (-) Transcript_16117:1237-1536(-)
MGERERDRERGDKTAAWNKKTRLASCCFKQQGSRAYSLPFCVSVSSWHSITSLVDVVDKHIGTFLRHVRALAGEITPIKLSTAGPPGLAGLLASSEESV